MSFGFLSRCVLPGRLPGTCLGHGAGKHILGYLVPPGSACMNRGWGPSTATTRALVMHAVAARPLPVGRRLGGWLAGCLAAWLAGWLAGRFCGFVFRCLRVALSLCLCALAWSLFKFRRWGIGQGRKIKKGPFPNVNHLHKPACHSLRLVCACVRLRSPCRQRVPKNDRRRVRRIVLQHRCAELCAKPSQDAGNSIRYCCKPTEICKTTFLSGQKMHMPEQRSK